MNNTLYRKTQGQIICGVCNGIAEQLGVDPNAVRLIAVVLSAGSFGTGALVYFIAAALLPER